MNIVKIRGALQNMALRGVKTSDCRKQPDNWIATDAYHHKSYIREERTILLTSIIFCFSLVNCWQGPSYPSPIHPSKSQL